jgi:hypothetical protein
MPERLADAIDELAQPSRPQRKEEPQIQADPALRRPRLLRNAPAAFRDENTDFGGAGFNAENVWFDDAKFESDAVFTGAMFRASASRSTVPRSAARTTHSTKRSSPASTSRFAVRASPARKRRSCPRSSSACARRSIHPPSGRTSNSTGTRQTSGEKACRRFLVASRRDHGRPTWLARSRSPVRAHGSIRADGYPP